MIIINQNLHLQKRLSTPLISRGIDDEIPLDLPYLSESKTSNDFEEDTFGNLSQMSSQQFIPQAKDFETALDKVEVITRDKIKNEKFALKFEAKISAIKNYAYCFG